MNQWLEKETFGEERLGADLKKNCLLYEDWFYSDCLGGLHAKDLPYGRWHATGEEELSADWG